MVVVVAGRWCGTYKPSPSLSRAPSSSSFWRKRLVKRNRCAAMAVGYAAMASALRSLESLKGASAVLEWDELVVMKERAAKARASQKAALAEVIHAKETDQALEALIVSAEAEVTDGEVTDAMDIACVRDARRNYDIKNKIPPRLAKLHAELGSEGYQTWAKAKDADDFAMFQPVLQRLVTLRRDMATAVHGENPHVYNFMIDQFERGMEVDRLNEIFSELKTGLVPLIKEVTEAKQLVVDSRLAGDGSFSFDVAKQEAMCGSVAKMLGFQGRLDTSVHPFTGGSHPTDVRITTRYTETEFVSSLMGLVHETGHALYEEGRPDAEYEGLPVSEALSMGIHESMSLLFERMVGQSLEFWTFLKPEIEETFPELKGINAIEYYKAVNKVGSSLIRVDADELTYPLHIIIRFELEQGLLDGSIETKDIPSEWNKRMKTYLNVEVPSNKMGCLQDVHWSDGSFGYFPSYTLGAMYAAQFFKKAEEDVPNLRQDIANGSFDGLKKWLKDNIHSKGSLYPSADALCEAVTGEPLNTSIFLDYLRKKYTALYLV